MIKDKKDTRWIDSAELDFYMESWENIVEPPDIFLAYQDESRNSNSCFRVVSLLLYSRHCVSDSVEKNYLYAINIFHLVPSDHSSQLVLLQEKHAVPPMDPPSMRSMEDRH